MPKKRRRVRVDRSGGESPKKATKPRAKHDEIFKTTFSLLLGDLIELVIPELADMLDLRSPKFIEKEAFTDIPRGKRRECDLVAEAATRSGDPRLILVHVEIEGKFLSANDQKMLRYYMHLRLKYNRPVISICVNLKGSPVGVKVRQVVEKFGELEICRFSYIAFGLSKCLAEEYVDRPQALAPALAALMRSRAWDKVEKKLHCLSAISRARLDDARRYVLANVVNTYVQLNHEEEARFAAALSSKANKEVRDMEITWEQALAARRAEGIAEGKAEGIAEGKAEGIAEGIAEGKVEATREAIILALNRRVGSVPDEVVELLTSISDIKRLQSILEQAVSVNSLDGIDFAKPS
jgi:hypothetical protein